MGRLHGRVVATTRAADPEDALVKRLLAEGARVVVWPTIATDDPEDAGPLMGAARSLEAYDWVVFTSPRAVQALVIHAQPRLGGRPRIAAVGDATAAALVKEGWPADVVAGGEGARALAEAMDADGLARGDRVLFPASSLARSTLEDALRAKGAEVDRVEAYRTRVVPPDAARVRADLASGVDVVTFASPSAVQAMSEALGDLPAALGPTRVAAIGRTTADALGERGVRDVEIGTEPGMGGLVNACVTLTNRDPRRT
jgi:uroporphyrinogen III methyltransferase/synthase